MTLSVWDFAGQKVGHLDDRERERERESEREGEERERVNSKPS